MLVMNLEYLVSNETDYQNISSYFNETGTDNSVYIGVGPDQNYTYISLCSPKLAFIVDYRPDNQLLHLLFKAIFALSYNRVDYLSLLFSKPIDKSKTSGNIGLSKLVEYFEYTDGDSQLFDKNLTRILKKIQSFDNKLTLNEITKIRNIYSEFFQTHLNLRCRFPRKTSSGMPYPTYKDFLLSTDQNGYCHNFINNDNYFCYVKNKHEKNQILPITGDFSGLNTLSTIGSFCQKHNLLISTIYISNVEYRLLNDHLFESYMRNLKSLPINDRSIIIRTFYNRPGEIHPNCVGNNLFTTLAQYIKSFIKIYDEGRYKSYWDVGTLDYLNVD